MHIQKKELDWLLTTQAPILLDLILDTIKVGLSACLSNDSLPISSNSTDTLKGFCNIKCCSIEKAELNFKFRGKEHKINLAMPYNLIQLQNARNYFYSALGILEKAVRKSVSKNELIHVILIGQINV